MPELRKALKFSKYTLGFTLPPKYYKALGLVPGDFVEISLENPGEILIKKLHWRKKT